MFIVCGALKLFFTPHAGRWRQQSNEMNKECNNNIKNDNCISCNSLTNVILGYYFNCSNSDLSSHRCTRVLIQLTTLIVLHKCVPTITWVHSVAKMHFNKQLVLWKLSGTEEMRESHDLAYKVHFNHTGRQ